MAPNDNTNNNNNNNNQNRRRRLKPTDLRQKSKKTAAAADQEAPNTSDTTAANAASSSSSAALKSTTSLGKRRSLARQKHANHQHHHNNNNQDSAAQDYGSQMSPAIKSSTSSGEICKVAILGAAGGIGQPLSLLLMLHSEYIQHLALYDVAFMHGVGADLAHVDRQCRVTTHLGPNELAECVRDCKVVVIPAGLAQKPGMSRDDLFASNATIMFDIAKTCAIHAPNAMLAIISNPVNSLVPLTCEVYKRYAATGKQADNHQASSDCMRRIFGVTTLDVVRASTLTARSSFFKQEPNGLFRDPAKLSIPVVGGHAGKTIVPILSQCHPKIDEKRLQDDKAATNALVESIQEAGIHVLNAKQGRGSATLAMAYAACRFTISLLRAIQGENNVSECAYVRQGNLGFDSLEYFSTPLIIGKHGWTRSLGLGKLLPYEQQMVADAIPELKTSIAKGEDFAKTKLAEEK